MCVIKWRRRLLQSRYVRLLVVLLGQRARENSDFAKEAQNWEKLAADVDAAYVHCLSSLYV